MRHPVYRLPIKLSQHENGIDEHKHVSASHFDGVKEDCVTRHIAPAAPGVRVHFDAREGGV